MKYILIIDVLDRCPELQIDETRYKALAAARHVLANALAIEEKYEIFLANYLDLENELVGKAVREMVRTHLDYEDFFQLRLDSNKRLVNLLTAGRLYIDQLSQHVCNCSDDREATHDTVKKLLSEQYEAHPEYRFIEALRNYVQHRGIPVHLTQLGSHRDDQEGLECSFNIASMRRILEEDPKFKKEVLNELSERIDLKAATRRYVESLNIVHLAARDLVEAKVNESRALIERARADYAAIYEGNLTGLSAFVLSDDGERIASFPILLDWDDIRVKLLRKNGRLGSLSTRYVSSRIKPRV